MGVSGARGGRQRRSGKGTRCRIQAAFLQDETRERGNGKTGRDSGYFAACCGGGSLFPKQGAGGGLHPVTFAVSGVKIMAFCPVNQKTVHKKKDRQYFACPSVLALCIAFIYGLPITWSDAP